MRKVVLKFFLSFYRWVISPVIHSLAGPGWGCRFHPTCSEYAAEAIQSHGLLAGTMISLKRLARCNPFGRHGYDPVPSEATRR